MKQTALFERHLASHGKMVPFSGWQMPLHYGSQVEEHHAVRQHVGLFDVSHMLLVNIVGREANTFLRRLLANDIQKIYPGKALYTCMLNDAGGILDDLIVYHISESHFTLIVNAGTAEKDLAWIREKGQGYDLDIEPYRDTALIAIQGPEAKNYLEKAGISADIKPFHCEQHNDFLIARTGYTGEDGYEIAINNAQVTTFWDQLIALGVRPCGLGARDTLRLEAGLNLYGQDMDETTHPFESNLTWTVDFKDLRREFVGRQALEEILNHGASQRLVGLVLQAPGIMRHGMPLYAPHESEKIGEITSGGFSPTLNKSIALARIQKNDLSALEVEIRKKRVKANVIKPPFVKAGKATF